MKEMTTEELREKIAKWRITLLRAAGELFDLDFAYVTEYVHPEDAMRLLEMLSKVEAAIYDVNVDIRKVSKELIKIIRGDEE